MDTAETIRSILAGEVFVEVPIAEMDDDDSLTDVFGLDSLALTELRVQCDVAFDIEIGDDRFTADHFASIGTLATLVDRLLIERGEGGAGSDGAQ